MGWSKPIYSSDFISAALVQCTEEKKMQKITRKEKKKSKKEKKR